MTYFRILIICFLFPFALCANGNKKQTAVSYNQVKDNQIDFTIQGGGKLSLTFCSGSVVKIWYDPVGVLKRKNESFAVINEVLEEVGKISVDEQESCYEMYTGNLRIRVNKNPLQIQIFDKWQRLIFSDYKEMGHISDDKNLRKTAYKVLREDEQFYGLGEKSGPLNRRGRSYKMWNSDRPCYSTTEDPLYKSIPFFMSNYNYGIFLDNTYKTEFKFGVESNDYYSFEAPNGEFIYYFIFGKDYKEILSQYIELTGKPIMPPKWAFGFAQCRGLYTKEQQALDVAAEFRKREIPCDIIYQDIGWTQYLQDFNWRKENYSQPQKMLQTLKSQGFKMVVSQDPVVAQNNKLQWNDANNKQLFVKDIRTGKAYDMPWPWGGNCGVVDFTLPEAADWWGKLQQKPIDDGVNGFWTDMGEPAWSNEEDVDRLNMQHHLGMHDEIHNVYGLTWDKVVTEQFNKRNPNQRIFQMTRAAYAGLQRYTFGWTGDSGNPYEVEEGWEQFENQVNIGISAGIGGIPFWTTDISGYCGDITDYSAMAELYTRWMQFGVFNPLSRAHHEGDNAVEPWMFGDVAERNSKEAIELKYQLFPYLYTYARKAYDTGLPIVRGLFMEYPRDPEAVAIEDQFMFGEELLIAPVLQKGVRVKRVYLPVGEWIDFNDKKTVYLGGQTISYRAPLNVIPIFVKKGSVIPQMPIMQYIHEDENYPLLIDVFPNYEDELAEFELYEDDGVSLDYQKGIYSKINFVCLTEQDGYETTITVDEKGFRQSSKRNIVLKYHLEEKPNEVFLDGKKSKSKDMFEMNDFIASDYKSNAWSWDEEKKECWVKIPYSTQKTTVSIK